MKTSISRIFTGILLTVLAGNLVIPVSNAHAALDLYNPKKHYNDEKQDFENPESRCLTKETRARHAVVLALAAKDGEKYGLNASSTGELAQAHERYTDGLDIVWEAMEEPYCGFGAFGLKAAKKSYEKSVTRLRQRFLDRAKQLKAEIVKAPAPVVMAAKK